MALAAGIAVAACASQAQQREADLAQLTQWLPGTYNNDAQAEADAGRGIQPPHEKLVLAIVPIEAPRIGRAVFYMQEMAAEDPRRVMAQKVLAFEPTERGIIEKVWSFAEPRRWRDGHLNPDLFRALVQDDLAASSGCELTWKKGAGRFSGASDPSRCHGGARGGVALAQFESRAELGPQELAIAERAYDAGGRLVQGRQDEPFYRFRRQGQ